jgi:hypothetical protein
MILVPGEEFTHPRYPSRSCSQLLSNSRAQDAWSHGSRAPSPPRVETGMMSENWYEAVDAGAGLTQGDLILNCPLLKWQLDNSISETALVEVAEPVRLLAAVRAVRAYVVVMTQACDLEHDKVADVVLCPCRTLSVYREAWAADMGSRGQRPTDKSWGRFCDDIRDGYVWNLFLMDALNDGPIRTEHRVVDFHAVHTIPRSFLDALLVADGGSRLRLRSPYREHLSQAFARFFMRVGLPSPISKVW